MPSEPVGETEGNGKPGILKNGLDAAEAGRRSGEARRAKKEQAKLDAASLLAGKNHETESGDRNDTRLLAVPIRIGQIIQAYEAKAQAGDVNAGRELRSWLDKYPPTEDIAFDPSTLEARERQALYARLLAEVRADEGEAPASTDIPAGT